MPLERLQKVIARSGVLSRRQAEELIAQGKVIVNGKKITVLGTKVDANTARITVRGKPISSKVSFHYLLIHKPKKCMVTRHDPQERKTVYDLIPKKWQHLKPVGRLDHDSEGLLLLTNDGELAQKLAHPQYHIRKIYEIKVDSHPGPRQLERLRKGILLDGIRTQPAEVKLLRQNPKSTWLEIELQEGRNRQIRRMCEKVNLNVKTLIRKKYGPFKLSGIPYGKWKLLAKLPPLFKEDVRGRFLILDLGTDIFSPFFG